MTTPARSDPGGWQEAPVIHLRREFSCDPAGLAGLRHLVCDTCRRAWAGAAAADVLDRLELGVQEAATNIVRHAYRGGPAGPIRLDLVADDDRVTVTLTHDGDDFDPAAVPPPSFDGSRPGGFGVYLIHQCMDRVCYLHGPAGHRGVRMTKHRAGPGGEPPMDLSVETVGDVTVITPNLEQIEVANADGVKDALIAAIGTSRKVVLDLDRVTFMDSRGCGVILSCLKHLAGGGGDLKLCRVTAPVRGVFDLIRLHKVCEITDTRETAVRAMG